MKSKPKKITSFLKNKEITAPIKQKIIKSLNHFFPDFNSSFVILARKFPIGIPNAKKIIDSENA